MTPRTMAFSTRMPSIKTLILVVLCIGFRAFAQFNSATVIGVVQDFLLGS
jgi:hypothetical protein